MSVGVVFCSVGGAVAVVNSSSSEFNSSIWFLNGTLSFTYSTDTGGGPPGAASSGLGVLLFIGRGCRARGKWLRVGARDAGGRS